MVISLAFSALMPILYIVAFLTVWIMFLVDKILLFRIYQKPINYSEDLQNKVFKIIYIAVVIHCVVSALTLSEPKLANLFSNF
jgi:hypothetical protein